MTITYNRTLLITAQNLKDSDKLNPNVENTYVENAIWEAQQLYIPHTVGVRLYNRLMSEVQREADEESYSMPEDYGMLLVNYVRDALIAASIKKLAFNITYKLDQRHLGTSNTTTDTTVTVEEFENAQDEYEKLRKSYSLRLRDFLLENRSTYPEFTDNVRYGVNPSETRSSLFHSSNSVNTNSIRGRIKRGLR